MKRNGHYANGKQRWYCKKCCKSCSRKNHGVKKKNTSVWFKKWLKEGYTIAQLVTISGLSGKTLLNSIHKQLEGEPSIVAQHSEHKYLIFDGTYLYKRSLALGVFCDEETGKVVAWKYGLHENSLPHLLIFFTQVRSQGINPISCTVDGNPHVIKALRHVWPSILIQRCIVHVQRQGLMWCRIHPKTAVAKQLRKLFITLLYIHTLEERDSWLKQVYVWEIKHSKLFEGTMNGWVMSDLKRAQSMLFKALPNIFHYLDDTKIPFSTNKVEGYFSKLKRAYKRHAGLSTKHRERFIVWFCSYNL